MLLFASVAAFAPSRPPSANAPRRILIAGAAKKKDVTAAAKEPVKFKAEMLFNPLVNPYLLAPYFVIGINVYAALNK